MVHIVQGDDEKEWVGILMGFSWQLGNSHGNEWDLEVLTDPNRKFDFGIEFSDGAWLRAYPISGRDSFSFSHKKEPHIKCIHVLPYKSE